MSLLTLNNIEVVYDQVFLAVKGVSIELPEGGLVALLGANGAGKSTVLKSISGLLKPERGEVSRGEVLFDGRNILSMDAPERVRAGIVHCLEGRRVFGHLTPEENLIAATSMHGDRARVRDLVAQMGQRSGVGRRASCSSVSAAMAARGIGGSTGRPTPRCFPVRIVLMNWSAVHPPRPVRLSGVRFAE